MIDLGVINYTMFKRFFVAAVALVALTLMVPGISFSQAEGKKISNFKMAETLTVQGRSLLKSGRLPDAIAFFEKAKSLAPNYPPAYFYLGTIYMKTFRYDLAEKEFLSAIKMDKKSAQLHKILAEDYIKWAEDEENKGKENNLKKAKNLRKKAEENLEKALNLPFTGNQEQKLKETYILLGKNSYKLGEYDNAIQALKRGAEFDSKDPVIKLYIGKAYTEKKSYKEAKEHLKQLDVLAKGNTEILKEAKETMKIVKNAEGKKLFGIIKNIFIVLFFLAVIGVVVYLFKTGKIGRRKSDFGGDILKGEDLLDDYIPVSKKDVEATINEKESQPEERTEGPERSDRDLNTPEGIGKYAKSRFMDLLQMPRGIIYIQNDSGTMLIPKVEFGLEIDAPNLEMIKQEVATWIVEKDGKPFVFIKEKKEISYHKAFPNSSSVLGEFEMRVGVPFSSDKRFLGIAYFGCEEKEKQKFKKLYDQNYDELVNIAKEISDILINTVGKRQDNTDSSTGLNNEAYFNEKFPQMVEDARKSGKACSLIILGIDDYNEMISTYNPEYGEKLIKMATAAVLEATGNSGATPVRLKESKFAVIFPGASIDRAAEMAESIREGIAGIKVARHIPSSRASIGVGTFPVVAVDAEKLIELVSDAQKTSEEEGGNQVKIAEKKLQTMETTRISKDQILAAMERRNQEKKAEGSFASPSLDTPIISTGSPDGLAKASRDFSVKIDPLEPSPWKSHAVNAPLPDRQRVHPMEPEPQMGVQAQESYPSFQQPVFPKSNIDAGPSAQDIEKDFSPDRVMPVSITSGSEDTGRSINAGDNISVVAVKQQKAEELRIADEIDEDEDSNSRGEKKLNIPPPPKEVGVAHAGLFRRSSSQERSRIPLSVKSDEKPRIKDEYSDSREIIEQDSGFEEDQKSSGPLDFSKEMKIIEDKEIKIKAAEPSQIPKDTGRIDIKNEPRKIELSRIELSKTMPQPPPIGKPEDKSVSSAAVLSAANTDPLTGFFQRSTFEQSLLSEAQRLKESPGECTLLYLGVDEYNDLKIKHGPAKLRKLIRDFAEKVNVFVQEEKIIPGRIEENGFALFLPGIPYFIGMDLANRIRETIKDMPFYDFAPGITISIGVASYPKTVKNFREIIISSRNLMEKAMREGGNKVESPM